MPLVARQPNGALGLIVAWMQQQEAQGKPPLGPEPKFSSLVVVGIIMGGIAGLFMWVWVFALHSVFLPSRAFDTPQNRFFFISCTL
jgi:hypothetical protein